MKKISTIKNIKFSDVFISQTSTLVFDFLKLGKKFKIISSDYKFDLTSSKLKKKYKINI